MSDSNRVPGMGLTPAEQVEVAARPAWLGRTVLPLVVEALKQLAQLARFEDVFDPVPPRLVAGLAASSSGEVGTLSVDDRRAEQAARDAGTTRESTNWAAEAQKARAAAYQSIADARVEPDLSSRSHKAHVAALSMQLARSLDNVQAVMAMPSTRDTGSLSADERRNEQAARDVARSRVSAPASDVSTEASRLAQQPTQSARARL